MLALSRSSISYSTIFSTQDEVEKNARWRLFCQVEEDSVMSVFWQLDHDGRFFKYSSTMGKFGIRICILFFRFFFTCSVSVQCLVTLYVRGCINIQILFFLDIFVMELMK